MNYTVLGISFLRSSLIALLALSAASVIVRYIQSGRNRLPIFFQALLLLCFFVPTIAIGYGYSYFSFLFIQDPWICNLIYFLIMVCRLTPPAILVLYFIPPAVSNNGLHCFNLTLKKEQKFPALLKYWWFMLRGGGRPQIAAMALLFLLAFTEFELGSLLNILSWPVFVFDSHAHGTPITDSLKLCLFPGFAEALAIWVFLLLADRGYLKSSLSSVEIKKCSPRQKAMAILLMLFGISVIIILPLIMILRYAVPGSVLLFREFWMTREIINAGIFALIGTVLACIAAFLLGSYYQSSIRWKRNLSLMLLIPGLLGSLPLGLVILGIFQFPGLNGLYNTPIPLSLALTFFLFPYTFIILLVLKTVVPGESIHAAVLAAKGTGSKQTGQDLLWYLLYRGRFWLFFLILSRGFFDLTLAGILAPTGMPTISTRLYNLMHYGESEKLSATVLLTILLPLALVIFLRFFAKKGLSKCCGN